MKASKAALRDHFHPGYPDFNTEYPDQLRADIFLNEFDDFVRARKEGKGTELPAFVLLYLPDDHTHGTTPGKPKPSASVADNDLAVGRVVEAVDRVRDQQIFARHSATAFCGQPLLHHRQHDAHHGNLVGTSTHESE
jgi:hypothetical protein